MEELRLPLLQGKGQTRLVDVEHQREGDVHRRSPTLLCHVGP